MKTYTCAQCGKVFESAWTEEEALAEAKQNYGHVPKEDRAIVCDPCHEIMLPFLMAQQRRIQNLN